MSELKPCPFCGAIPDFPNGDGTQYEITCECGRAQSTAQICDLMTIEERNEPDDWAETFRYKEVYIERAKQYCIEQWNVCHIPEGYALVPVAYHCTVNGPIDNEKHCVMDDECDLTPGDCQHTESLEAKEKCKYWREVVIEEGE